MAGLSSRFSEAGFEHPKYMLKAKGRTLFEHSVLSFQEYFHKELFVFIVRDLFGAKDFVEIKSKELGITSYKVVTLEKPTLGQADTVYQGLKKLDLDERDETLTIFNIDTFRPGLILPLNCTEFDGYLEVFEGDGDNWSFIKVSHDNPALVSLTTEKEPVSNLCSTGLYYFLNTSDFMEAFTFYASKPKNEWTRGELYIAPLYNYLINNGKSITYNLIEKNDVIFCGTPKEYYDFDPSAHNPLK